MLKLSLFAAALALSSAAYADEVVIHRDAPDVVETPAPSSTTTVEKHGPGCDSKTVHTESADGDSHTVSRQDCD